MSTSIEEPYTPSLESIRDDFARLYDSDQNIIRARKDQFDRRLALLLGEQHERTVALVLEAVADQTDDVRQRVADALEKARKVV